MIEQIVTTLTSGEPLDLEQPELAAALEDADFRKEMLRGVAEALGFIDQIDFEGDDAREVMDSAEGAKGFLMSMQAMAAFSDMVDEEMVAATGPVESLPNLQPPPGDCSPADLNAALESLSRSFFIEGGFSGHANVAGDLIGLPNGELAELTVKWSGVNPPDPDDPFAGGRVYDGSYSERINLGDEEAEPPATFEGQATITLPVRFDSASFSASEIDQSKPVGDAGSDSTGGASATLTRCEFDCVSVTIEGLSPGTEPIIVAKDAVGQRLGSTESMRSHKDGCHCQYRFTGTVATVDVLLPVESVTREVNVVATKEPEWDGENYALAAAPRYVRGSAEPQFVNMSAADLAGDLELAAGRLNSSFEFNQPSVHCHLPRVDNSHLAMVDFDEVSVYDSDGNVIECETVGRGYKAEYQCASVSFEDMSTGELVPLSRAAGTVKVTYPLAVKAVTLTTDAPSSDGIEATFDGSMVSVKMNDGDDESPFDSYWVGSGMNDTIAKVQAFDDTGRPLKRLSYSGSRNGASFFAFWGQPTSLRVLQVAEHDTVELPFDLPPAPMLAAELAGSEGEHTRCRKK